MAISRGIIISQLVQLVTPKSFVVLYDTRWLHYDSSTNSKSEKALLLITDKRIYRYYSSSIQPWERFYNYLKKEDGFSSAANKWFDLMSQNLFFPLMVPLNDIRSICFYCTNWKLRAAFDKTVLKIPRQGIWFTLCKAQTSIQTRAPP